MQSTTSHPISLRSILFNGFKRSLEFADCNKSCRPRLLFVHVDPTVPNSHTIFCLNEDHRNKSLHDEKQRLPIEGALLSRIPIWSTCLFYIQRNAEHHLYWRAIAQAVSRCLPTAAARTRAQVSSCGICGEQVMLERVFSEHFRSH
jgi:hypothetical protein